MTTEIRNIQAAYENMYGKSIMLSEAIHKEIQSILDSDSIDPKQKLSHVSRKAKTLIASGESTGFESDKPKKGSSRAVFFPKDPKEITVDGVKTKTPTAVKIAFPGVLDAHHGESTTMGEDQNALESDHYINNSYGVLRHNSHTGEYHSNEHGVLAPVFDTHPEHHHLEMGRVDKFNAKDMASATKTKEFPKGLKLDEVTTTMKYHHDQAHGQRPYLNGYSEEHMEKVADHPWVSNAISMMHDSGMHPGDVSPRNMGIYTHPVTGEKHPVMIDYGFSNDIAKKYSTARMNMIKKKRGY